MTKLNKNELIELVSERARLSKRDAREAIENFLDLIENALLNGQEVNLTNFGVLEPRAREGRVGTHPKEHTTIEIKPSKTITFRVSKSLKAKLNG